MLAKPLSLSPLFSRALRSSIFSLFSSLSGPGRAPAWVAPGPPAGLALSWTAQKVAFTRLSPTRNSSQCFLFLLVVLVIVGGVSLKRCGPPK